MKAVIKLDVPEFQIGEEVSVYFKDTMYKKGICEQEKEIIRCKDCKKRDGVEECPIAHLLALFPTDFPKEFYETTDDWFCADGTK